MPLRYLLGPVNNAFIANFLSGPRAAGSCRAFGPESADFDLASCATWAEVVERLGGFAADVVVLHPAYGVLPRWLDSCPLPRVVLALDANLHLHAYRHLLANSEVVLADAPTVAVLRRAGLTNARAALLYGLGASWGADTPVEAARPCQILHLGNVHPTIQAERLPWLDRLARLGDRYTVRIGTDVAGAAYREAMSQAQVVFNRSIRGEANQRVFETLAAGALLFQEAGNAEVESILEPGRDYVAYTDENLESLLDRYLGDHALRMEVAARGQAKLASLTFAAQWQGIVTTLEAELPALRERASQRPPVNVRDQLLGRIWLRLAGGMDATLRRDLVEAFASTTEDDAHREAVVALVTLLCQAGDDSDFPLLARLDAALVRWLQRRPNDLLLSAQRVGLALRLGKVAEACQLAEVALRGADRPLLDADLERLPPPVLGFDRIRVEWERAAWDAHTPAAERVAKATLLRWWLHAQVGQNGGDGGDLTHAYEAVLTRPDQPGPRGLLGYLLLRAGRAAQAVPHLRQALAANPLDRQAANLLHGALLHLRAGDELAELQAERQRWHRVAPQLVPVESWWQVRPVPKQEELPLVSIVILCCNALEVTRGCLDSLLARTQTPYEIILVDNGSTDGTLDYLTTLPGRVGPQRWVLLQNEHNRGFAAGCNQGLSAAQGQLICFLNNDVILPHGWLEALRAALVTGAGERPVGMVGPVANFTLPTQTVPPSYSTTEEFATFAQRRARDFAGVYRDVEVLSGFCLLARRDVLAQAAGFDERYGIGTFEDNDLSLKVRQAGYRLRVAEGVYLHHHGSRTFRALGIDPRQQQERNEQIFRAKWFPQNGATTTPTPTATPQPTAATPTRISLATPVPTTTPTPTPTPATTPTRLDLAAALPLPLRGRRRSLTMIVRNEAANLAACVTPLLDLFDEIIINDTGSVDNTVEIALALGPKVRVLTNEWQNSFAIARNQALDAATGDWIFWMDGDDRLDPENVRKLLALLDSLTEEPVAFSMRVWCSPAPGEGGVGTVVNHVRLFPRAANIRWEHRIHEQILMPLRRAGVPVLESDVLIEHIGYQDAVVLAEKSARDLALLYLDLADRPDSTFTHFNLGNQLFTLGRHKEALAHLDAALNFTDGPTSITRKLFSLAAQCHRDLDDPGAAERVLVTGLGYCPDDPELLFFLGAAQRARGDRLAAIATYERLLATEVRPQFASVDPGLRGYKGAHNLAALYLAEGRWPAAEALWRDVTRNQPGFADGWVGLARVCLIQGKWADAEAVLARLEELGLATEAVELRTEFPRPAQG